MTIFPSNGVIFSQAASGASTGLNLSASCNELWMSNNCDVKIPPEVINTLISEVVQAVNGAGVTYDCSVTNNLSGVLTTVSTNAANALTTANGVAATAANALATANTAQTTATAAQTAANNASAQGAGLQTQIDGNDTDIAANAAAISALQSSGSYPGGMAQGTIV